MAAELSQAEVDALLKPGRNEVDAVAVVASARPAADVPKEEEARLLKKPTCFGVFRLKPNLIPPLVVAHRILRRIDECPNIRPGDWMVTDLASKKTRVMSDAGFRMLYERMPEGQLIRASGR